MLWSLWRWNLNTEQEENTENPTIQRTSFSKEKVENEDLSKLVLNKTMTTHE